jgi:mersacidin/lichenicidin family type 2 lantibiotic
MEKDVIVRAWKDPVFRASLDEGQRALIPPNPAGPAFTDVPEAELVSWTFAVTCRWPVSADSPTEIGSPSTGCQDKA